ncbi:uracil permease [Pediococcus stilesii]|uniref:Uracil permease n=1 Tax=Pediococcus stilesii TaxID=331679 RepID=A0A5R9BYL0_9LACO|nr:solute carrier family 23 protein [Pediococcus stilesii]TLQ04942.1 uracil permease [Pediococcus stilesii]
MSKHEEYRNPEAILDIHDKPTFPHLLGLSIQHMFAMFGSTVLVPILVGLNPGIALFSSGVGTLLYILITQAKIPAYMGSSFTFIVPMMALMKTTGYEGIAQGTISVGIVYLVVALVISQLGSDWLDKILPPIVVGPIIMVIGLSLAGTAATDATMRTVGKSSVYDIKYFMIALVTLLVTIAFNMYLKGFISLIPILLGLIVGYLFALMMGVVDLSGVEQAKWLTAPAFEIPFINYKLHFNIGAVLSMMPLAFVTMTEHTGHIMVLNTLTHRNFFKDPGLHRTLSGDGLASIVAGFIGGPPVTSYGENIGVLAVTRVHSVYVLMGAALSAIIFSFVGKLSALIQSIPSPVIGGISFLLFGTIAANGLRILIDEKVDFNKKRNLMIAASILVIGIGNASFNVGNLSFSGLAVATVLGVALNLILPQQALSEK